MRGCVGAHASLPDHRRRPPHRATRIATFGCMQEGAILTRGPRRSRSEYSSHASCSARLVPLTARPPPSRADKARAWLHARARRAMREPRAASAIAGGRCFENRRRPPARPMTPARCAHGARCSRQATIAPACPKRHAAAARYEPPRPAKKQTQGMGKYRRVHKGWIRGLAKTHTMRMRGSTQSCNTSGAANCHFGRPPEQLVPRGQRCCLPSPNRFM